MQNDILNGYKNEIHHSWKMNVETLMSKYTKNNLSLQTGRKIRFTSKFREQFMKMKNFGETFLPFKSIYQRFSANQLRQQISMSCKQMQYGYYCKERITNKSIELQMWTHLNPYS